jgi:hypothetical protein
MSPRRRATAVDADVADRRVRLAAAARLALVDPSLALPPWRSPNWTSWRASSTTPHWRPRRGRPRLVSWQLDYYHPQFGNVPPTLRSDPSTGYTRRLDTDVLALVMSRRLAGNEVGLGYQLQSARGGFGGDAGLGRFLPGSEAATHAFTLGLTRPFGAGLPPPAPPPLLVVVDKPSAESTPSPTP